MSWPGSSHWSRRRAEDTTVSSGPSPINAMDSFLAGRKERKPPKSKELAITLPEGVVTFRKKDMSGKGQKRPRSVLLIAGKATPILPGPAAPLEGILTAIPETAAGLVVRHAIEKGAVTWAPSEGAAPRLSTRATRDPFVVDNKPVRETYRRIAAGLVSCVDEVALLAYIERVLDVQMLAEGIFPRMYRALSDHATPELAPVLGPFNGFCYIQIEKLFTYVGLVEGWRALTATEQQADPNWCRVLQDFEDSPRGADYSPTPRLSYYEPHQGRPALVSCWVRPRYRASSSAVEAAALAVGIPAAVTPPEGAELPLLTFHADTLEASTALRWVCAGGLALKSEDGRVHLQVQAPLRASNHEDLAAGFSSTQRASFERAASAASSDGRPPLALHPVALGELPAYLRRSDEAVAHALLDVACEEWDPGRLTEHLGEPARTRYWYEYPILVDQYRASLAAVAASQSDMPDAVAARIVSAVARLAHTADAELAPQLAAGRALGLDAQVLLELDRAVEAVRETARRVSSMDRLLVERRSAGQT